LFEAEIKADIGTPVARKIKLLNLINMAVIGCESGGRPGKELKGDEREAR
jgi:hypothetical protein